MQLRTTVLALTTAIVCACGEPGSEAQDARGSSAPGDFGATDDSEQPDPSSDDPPVLAIEGCPSFTARNSQHVSAGRAHAVTTGTSVFRRTTTYYANGTDENLGTSRTTRRTLYEISPGVFSLNAANCPSSGTGGSSGAGGSSGSGGSAGSGGGGSAGTGGTGGTGSAAPHPTALPTPRGACPTLRDGVVSVLGRQVTLWMGTDGESKLGPVVFYWHATGSGPNEAMFGLGSAAISEIKSMGGIVVAMNAYDGASSGGSTTGNNVWFTGDFDVTDEVLACAIRTGVGIDTARIHTLGFSAGALHASYMLKARSNYLASVVSYSGGAAFPAPTQDAANKLPIVLFHGGSSDSVVISFEQASIQLANDLKAKGHFVVMCNHGGGHSIPSAGAATAWQFFKDHPYEKSPAPYAAGLPTSFPSYCSIF